MALRSTFSAAVAAFSLLFALDGQPSPAQAQRPTAAQTQKPPVGPAAPQSTHFPVLLLAVGINPAWNLRIGPNGPERLDRPAYPPIPLEPGEVSQEAANAWVYHAKDTATGAAVSVLITRDNCSDGTPTKYSFRAVAQHAQLGTLNGCARIAAELYPRTNNQDEDTDDAAKKKPAPDTTVTTFKMPIDTAYISPTGKIILRHASAPHIVAQEGSQLALSHDGKHLLYTREQAAGERAVALYDATTGKTADLLTGNVQEPFWSPDDTRVAFMKFLDGHWHLWIAPVNAPATATSAYSGEVAAIDGWADAHTVLVDDLTQLSWVGDDGGVQRTVPNKDIYGEGFAGVSSGNTVRVHPLNPDLLLVSAEMTRPAPSSPKIPKMETGAGFFLYEIASKRRVTLSPPELLAGHAEWSRDGLQIFFTGTDASRRTATYHIFWDGGTPKRFTDGHDLVIGQ